MDLADPIAIALAIAEALRREQVEHALYGGLLLAAYGEARETRDVDLAVVHADASATASLIERHLGLHTTPAFDRREFGGLSISRITLVEGDELNTLDLVEPKNPDYASRALARSVTSSLRGQRIDVLAAEDFVIFKLLSTRDRDLDDAVSVLRSLSGSVEQELIEAEVERLDAGSPGHAVAARWRRVLDAVDGA